MSLTSIGFQITVTLVDRGGDTSTLRFKTGANVATFADLLTAKTNLVAALADVTSAKIATVNCSELFEDSAIDIGDAGDVSELAIVSARLDTTPIKFSTIKIPAPASALFVEQSGPLFNQVDPASEDLVTYLSLYESTGPLTTSDGERLADAGTPANLKGWRAHRASRG